MAVSSTTLSSPTPPECLQQQEAPRPPATRGRLVVLTGPSGVGKGTLVSQLRQRHPELYFSVSVTTRPPRPGEQEGVNYYFRTREEFLNLIEADELLEWAQYAGNFYGTPREIVFQKLSQGQDVLLEIELAGARQVRQQCPDAIRIFLSPPSLEELERRIRERGQDSEASIQRRLQQARKELDAKDEFDYVIVNDNLEQALQELEALLYPPSPGKGQS
ncbi:guanylate kinase [Thermostichus sp. MS-CIW-21]|jgi:guanylate kinase|uniref:Guanylate kinase n=1 Tax=Synechococcus sp. (strain JA-3-3Ab) TaxID=321327 RepID=KGUA_SYNJA|nr:MULTISPECIES: guanylate kinase [unclassified Synechococcus]Q2JQB9.1 RecName: Full=Guanylate kinase; AltName: Full=GMP kinase [Synechococcus sp. JA-3-3Ab]ABD00807.1 putative guanylate kinase [Synechococcus sp. JA-3-3Ab]PIK84149.1 guanylate kinase [Synechococcus sp. 65AY6A5]PIK86403.1 guanylate kinase [Synechococcus sp. 63AY4M2]PIK91762.1 guanylate kinase [Synechococcus sp. 65AY6Li]PIK95467.1 guanylate kinase [Synechococcus sp. 60AY4M2]